MCVDACLCVLMCVYVCLPTGMGQRRYNYRDSLQIPPMELTVHFHNPDPSDPLEMFVFSLSLSLFISFIPVYQCSISLRLHSRTGRAISSVPISCVAVKLHNLTGHSLFVFPCLPVNLNIYFIIIIIIIKTLEKSRWQNSLTRRSFLVDSITGSSSATKRALKWVLFRQIIFLSNSF